ncbi:MAG: hypothetical protein ABI551_03630, partial [Polyangiaceae bacterium]
MRVSHLLSLASLSLALTSAIAACGSRHGSEPGAEVDAGSGLGGHDAGGKLTGCTPDPGNFDVPGNGCDDDGDGIVDNPAGCDDDLTALGDAAQFAKAIGLCKTIASASDPGWGVVSAAFTRGHASTTPPADGQHEILSSFGNVIVPREGKNLGVMSTGWARPYDDIEATSCDPATGIHCFKEGVVMQGGTPTAGA